MGADAAALCAERGWTVDEDLTEHVTGLGDPVMRVTTDDGPALLKTNLGEATVLITGKLASTGITPAVFDSGEDWLLLEWIEGTPLVNPLALQTGGLDDAIDSTDDVLAMLRRLHTVRAPDEARVAVEAELTELELGLCDSLKLWKSTPKIRRAAQGLFDPAYCCHGDVLPPNVVRTPDGTLRLIDVQGAFGPPEADAGRWVSFLILPFFHATSDLEHVKRAAEMAVQDVLASNPHLDRQRLFAWTAVSIAKMAASMLHQGESRDYVAAVTVVAGHLDTLAWKTVASAPKTGRNEKCPCGSGRKYKHCCLGVS